MQEVAGNGSKEKEYPMLWNTSSIKGHAVSARDGTIGSIVDFLFDDASWHLRWAVVETGGWLSGRKVLLPTSSIGPHDPDERVFPVELTKQQVKDSPNIDTERPVSRQMETHVYNYYGWSPYWGNGLYMGAYGYTAGMGTSPYLGRHTERQEAADAQRERDDPNLRSVDAVTGYHIHASDGGIGHVEDFLIEDADWGIHYLVVDTKNWWPGKKVLITPGSVHAIDWNTRLVDLDVDRDKVKASPPYDSSTTVDPAYENRFNTYYGGIGPNEHPVS
jgi:hypothetical protein